MPPTPLKTLMRKTKKI